MAPRIERPAGRNAPDRAAKNSPTSRNHAKQPPLLRDYGENRRPEAIFGQTALPSYAFVHASGNRNALIQETSNEADANDEQLERLLGLKPFTPSTKQSGDESSAPARLPRDYIQCLEWHYRNGRLSQDTARYYLTLNRGDSSIVPGQGGRPSLLRDVLLEDARSHTPSGWKLINELGTGGFGSVFLWEKARLNGPPIRTAIKDTEVSPFFRDYCAEAQFTRRLNDIGCKNVINVAEWAYIESVEVYDRGGRSHRTTSKHRICYEYAAYGDLFNLEAWYREKRLILPEAFLWHVFHSMANALLYCAWGRGGKSGLGERKDWDQICHGDIKEQNVLMADVDEDQHKFYPCIKLCDFGMAWTLHKEMPDIQRLKSAAKGYGDGIGGTAGYDAPEMSTQPEEAGRRREDHELVGSHSDIYALGKTMRYLAELVEDHIPYSDSRPDVFQRQNRQKLKLFYSTDFNALVAKCTYESARERPYPYDLWYTTKHHMEITEGIAKTQQQKAMDEGRHKGCFHSSVLFSKESRDRYDADPFFRAQYRTANLKPLWNLTGGDGPNQTSKPPLPVRRQPEAALKDTLPSLGDLKLVAGGGRVQVAEVAEQGGFRRLSELARDQARERERERRRQERNGQNVRHGNTTRGPMFGGIRKKITKMFGWGRR